MNRHLPPEEEVDNLLASYASEIEAALDDPEIGRARLLLLAHSIRNLAVARSVARMGGALDDGWPYD